MTRRTTISAALAAALAAGVAYAAVTAPLMIRASSGPRAADSTDTATVGVLQAALRLVSPTAGTSGAAQHAFPAGTASLVSQDSSDVLTNKSINCTVGTNTCTNVPAAQLTGTATQPLGTLPLRTAAGNSWSAPVAGNVAAFATQPANGANTFTLGGAFPDYRNLVICLNAGWDGGTVTCNGTDATGAPLSMATATVAACANDSRPWQTLTSCTKTTVGATANTATVGYGACLGIPTAHRAMRTFASTGFPAGLGVVNGVSDIVTSVSATGTAQDTCIQFTTSPNGARNFSFIGFWN